MINIMNEHQIFYLNPNDVLRIKKGCQPLKLKYVIVSFKKCVSTKTLEIDDIEVKELHSMLRSGKEKDLKKVFRRV